MMSRENLAEHLIKMHEVILAERQAAKELEVSKMLDLTAEKESLLKKILPFSDTVDKLTQAEKELSEVVYSENLRNAYFLSSALKWVRESIKFIGEKMVPESYEESGSVVKAHYSGALLSGRV
jgi:hypothetical protein